MQAATKVLRRPFSAWLLLTLIGVLFFFPDAPLVMHQMALLLALVPMLRLLPDRVFEVLGRWPYFGTALYLLYRLNILLLDQPMYYRLYTLGIALVSAATLVWLLLSSQRRHERAGTRPAHGAIRVFGLGRGGGPARRVGRQHRGQRVAGRDADRRGARQRLCRTGALCRRQRARLGAEPAAGAGAR